MRPFYCIGHNTNSLAEIRAGLEAGLNAFEVDVHKDAEGRLYISHDPVGEPWLPGGEPPPRVEPFLAALRRLADTEEGANIALVIFDCKVAEAELAVTLLDAVRRELTHGGRELHVIVSVPSLAAAETFFGPLYGQLTDHEALMIDEEDDPRRVAAFFAEKKVARAAYGNGITSVLGVGLPSPSLVQRMDVALALMAAGELRFVYPWVLVSANTMREFVRSGVNGAMVDVGDAGILARVLGEPEFANEVRLATRADDPLADCSSLVLEVETDDVSHAGTNATVTFSLETEDGQVVFKTVDGSYNGRFERGSVTPVTLAGVTLAPDRIRAISVAQDGSGLAPGWRLQSVTVRSCGHSSRRFAFDCEVTSNAPATRPA